MIEWIKEAWEELGLWIVLPIFFITAVTLLVLAIAWMLISIIIHANAGDMNAKKFMYFHPEFRLQVDGESSYRYGFNALNDHVLVFQIDGERYEMWRDGDGNFLTPWEWERIADTDYYFKQHPVMNCDISYKKEATPKSTKVEQPKPDKEERTMSLSIGTWIMLIITMVVISKTAHKLSLRTIFRPTKKAAKHVKEEWDES